MYSGSQQSLSHTSTSPKSVDSRNTGAETSSLLAGDLQTYNGSLAASSSLLTFGPARCCPRQVGYPLVVRKSLRMAL